MVKTSSKGDRKRLLATWPSMIRKGFKLKISHYYVNAQSSVIYIVQSTIPIRVRLFNSKSNRFPFLILSFSISCHLFRSRSLPHSLTHSLTWTRSFACCSCVWSLSSYFFSLYFIFIMHWYFVLPDSIHRIDLMGYRTHIIMCNINIFIVVSPIVLDMPCSI